MSGTTWPRIMLDTVDSTNCEAFRQADKNNGGSQWITAKRQTEGRGRRGRPWSSPDGNFYGSLLLRGGDDKRAHELCFVASLALRDVLAEFAGPLLPLTIKWPNDVLANERKCAGILVESRTAGLGRCETVIGIGVNLRAHPTDTAFAATDLAREGVTLDPDDVFTALAPKLEARLQTWRRSKDFSEVAEEWLRHAYRLGRTVHIRGEDPARDGIFKGLTEQGAMRLEMMDGTERTVIAGDVVPLLERRSP